MESEWMLQVKDLNKTVDREEVFKNVTFSFSKKGVHGILAPHGAGKTALMNALAGWDSSFTGEILLKDTSVEMDSYARKSQVGYVSANLALDSSMTVWETMDFVGKAKRVSKEKLEPQIKEALELVGLLERSKRLVGNLSEGEKRFLSIAVALLGNPKILLLDEPMRKISVEEREQMREMIRMLGGVKTVVLATASFEEAKALCCDVVMMAEGKVIAAGTFEELEQKLAQNQESGGMSLRSVYDALCGKEVRK